MQDKHPIHFNLDAPDHEKLRMLAEYHGVSMIGLFRMWIRREFRKVSKEIAA